MNDKEIKELFTINKEVNYGKALKYVCEEYNKLEVKLVERNLNLQSNWNSLRKCIIGVIEEARDELNTIIHTTDINTEDGLKYVNQCSREFDVIRKNLEIVLDKMNELEGKDKE